mmetsp:Transcript_19132/g.41393  ORF Transcript_19132/g.41393 Transcript_19132/m.41393 type:complete len:112 (-) Transcript_19132:268-603(-)
MLPPLSGSIGGLLRLTPALSEDVEDAALNTGLIVLVNATVHDLHSKSRLYGCFHTGTRTNLLLGTRTNEAHVHVCTHNNVNNTKTVVEMDLFRNTRSIRIPSSSEALGTCR